jgi:hypothetical protein
LAAPLAFGHVLGSSVTVAGQSIRIDFGAGQETATIASIGTPGPDGTGLTLAAPLSLAHATGSQVLIPTVSIDSGANQQTVTLTSVGTAGAGGTGISFTPPLNASHATGAVVIPTQP